MITVGQVGEISKYRLARSFLGRGWYFTACYWVDGLLIDTGCSYTVNELVAALAKTPITSIVNTHSHVDHIGANAILQAKYKIKIFAHPLALPILTAPREMQPLGIDMRWTWGHPKPSRGSEIGRVLETEHHRFEVIHTPGHSPDHIGLFEPNLGWFFSGDAYIAGKDRVLREGCDMWQIIESLKKIHQLNPSLLLSGSGSVRREPKDDILKKIEYLEDLGDRVLALHAKGMSLRKIRRTLLGLEKPFAYISFGNFSGSNLVRSYIENRPTTP